MKIQQTYWNRILLFLLGAVILMFTSANVRADSEKFRYIEDNEGVFSESFKQDYDEQFYNHLRKYGCFLLVTVGNQDDDDTGKLADEYLIENGISDKHSIVLLYYNLSNRSVGLATRGEARTIFPPEYNELFLERANELLDDRSFDDKELIRLYESYSLSVLDSARMEKLAIPEVKNYVDDTQNYFSEEAIAEANERLTRADSVFDMDIRITTQKRFKEKNIDLSAIEYIQEHNLGEEREDSAFLLYISKKPRKFSLMAKDRAQDVFSESERKDIFDAMLPLMKEDRYDEALTLFTDMTLKALTKLSVKKALSIPARKEGVYFYDYAPDPLSEELHKEIETGLEEVSEARDTDIVVYVEGNSREGNLYDRVSDFAIRNRLGDHRKNDAVIFYVDIKRELCLITGRGKGLRFLAESGASSMEEYFRDHFDVNHYEESIHEFITRIDAHIVKCVDKENKMAEGLNGKDVLSTGAGFGILAGLIGFVLFYIKTLKRAQANLIFDHQSTIDYVGGIVFHVTNDSLIKSTTRREYDKDNRGGSSSGDSYSSSSSYSSGGSSYGGTSGDY